MAEHLLNRISPFVRQAHNYHPPAVGIYGPPWMKSQNIATGDEWPYITVPTRQRLSDEQNKLFVGIRTA